MDQANRTLAQQIYETFMETVSRGHFIPWADLPPLFRGAWQGAVETVAGRAAEVVRECGTTGEAVEADQEYSPRDLLLVVAKAVEGIAKE